MRWWDGGSPINYGYMAEGRNSSKPVCQPNWVRQDISIVFALTSPTCLYEGHAFPKGATCPKPQIGTYWVCVSSVQCARGEAGFEVPTRCVPSRAAHYHFLCLNSRVYPFISENNKAPFCMYRQPCSVESNSCIIFSTKFSQLKNLIGRKILLRWSLFLC